MKNSKFYLSLCLAAALAFVVGCKKEDNPGGGGDDDVTEINGTKILEGNNAVGLVSNASTGKGIPGVPVTDGYTYTVTDDNGVYQMAANRYCRKVYISLPAEYAVPLDNTYHMPCLYSTKVFNKNKVNRNDFVLTPQPVEDKFTLVMIGDPQCQKDAQVQRYVKETVPDMLSTLSASAAKYAHPYGITLGDVTFDSYDTWGPMRASMANLKLGAGYFPIFQCIGNHDHNSKVTSGDYDATAKFVEVFGPTDYSFNRGKAHIVVMDDIIVTKIKSNSSPNSATWDYDGGFTKLQYDWLVEDLKHVDNKADKIIFLCLHIPFRGGSASGGSSINKTGKYYAEVLKLLTDFKDAHIMIGHTHYPQNYIHTGYKCKSGRPVYEHVHGAACGGWWSSNSNVTGAPNGYSLYEIEGNTVKNWIAKGTARAADYQVRVYDGNQIYSGTKGYTYEWYNPSNVGGSASIKAVGNALFRNCFVAEVWNDDSTNWKVEMYQNGVKIGDFKRIPDGGSCNVCITSYYFNELAKNTDSWTNKTASHYWYFKPESGQPKNEKNWEVRATQIIPDSGATNTYSSITLTTDYTEF